MFGGSLNPTYQKLGGLNSIGFRGPVPIMPKPHDEYRIVVVGGSTVLIGDPSISELLESYFYKIKKDKNNAKVYNFGVAASILRMDFARFVFTIFPYKPDLVIFYGGGNDIIMPHDYDPRAGYPPNFLVYENNPILSAGTEDQSIKQLALTALLHTQILQGPIAEKIKENYIIPLKKYRSQVNWPSEKWSKDISEAYITDVERAAQIIQGLGSKIVFVFQPTLYFKAHLSEEEKNNISLSLNRHSAICRKIMLEGLKKLGSEHNFEWLDLSDIFNSVTETVFFDGIHVHQKYQEYLAKPIFEKIRDYPPQ